MEPRKPEACGQEGCRETEFFIDNGLRFCRRGHQQLGQQAVDDDNFGVQGMTSQVKKPAAERVQKKYRGRQAYLLYLQIYQLILWKQCHALVNSRGFPSQLEHVIRDLWALRLETYSRKIAEVGDEDSQPEFFSSQPASAREDTETEMFTPGSKFVQWPRLIDTVALCYLGAILMRLPVSVAEFHQMTMRNEIPYYRVLTQIPLDMRDRLPNEYAALLDTTTLLKAEDLHTAVFDLLILYQRKFKMQFPPLNTPVLLYRLLRRLALPVDIYPVTKRLQTLLGFTFKYPTTVVSRRKPLDEPELQLVTLIVIATKLLFPFDDVQRHPTSTQELTVQAIDWGSWAEVQNRFDRRDASAGRIGKGKEILVNEGDVLNMNGDQLDAYLDWYENSWLDNNKGANPLTPFFPLGSASKENRQSEPTAEDDEEEAIEVMLHMAPRYLKSRAVVSSSEPDIPRPGSLYSRYRQESDLPDSARAFYEIAAKVIGVSISTLVRSVSQAETQINKWLEEQRRIKHFAEHSMKTPGDSDVENMEEYDERDIPEEDDE
ncbi:hypothetical protein BDW62DRAFT_171701 [Aspergillus aurantiobrunneus]